MRERARLPVVTLMALLTLSPVLLAQTGTPPATKPQTAVPTKGTQGAQVDLSGNWGFGFGTNFSQKGGPMDVGTPADGVPYQPWALAKLLTERPESGPRATFDNSTDPVIKFCDPAGVPRILGHPFKFKFLQTPDAVYILYESGPFWRTVWLNRKHPEDPDPTFWGHSIGHYEGSDTFVVDTVGLNDKTWLDDVGRPHTDKLHVIERYRRVDKNTLEATLTLEDPGAYTASWIYGPKSVKDRKTDFGAYPWVCTLDQNESLYNGVIKPTITQPAK